MPQEPVEVAGQSGSEGSLSSTPCFSESQQFVVAHVVAEREGCLSVEVERVLTEAASAAGRSPGDKFVGVSARFFGGERAAPGDEVLLALSPAPPLDPDSIVFRAVPIVDEAVTLLDGTNEVTLSLEQLADETCSEHFEGWSVAEPAGSEDPEGSSPGDLEVQPLSCPSLDEFE